MAHDLAVLDLREKVSHRLAGLVPPVLWVVTGGKGGGVEGWREVGGGGGKTGHI